MLNMKIVERINARHRLRHLLQEAKPYFWLFATILTLAIASYLLDPPLAGAAAVSSDDARTLAACMNGAHIAVGNSVMTCSITHYELIGGV